jgi:hypothetical protein
MLDFESLRKVFRGKIANKKKEKSIYSQFWKKKVAFMLKGYYTEYNKVDKKNSSESDTIKKILHVFRDFSTLILIISNFFISSLYSLSLLVESEEYHFSVELH